MEEIQSAAKNQNKQEKAEKVARENLKRRNEQILTSLCHSFHPVDSVVWDSLKEKLLDLEKKYYRKKSIFLCARCMTISTTAYRIPHDDITVRSLPDKIDIGASEGVDIGKFFLEYGRHKEDGENKIIVCFPSFNFDCDQIYHALEGSKKVENDEKPEAKQTKEEIVEKSNIENKQLAKRTPVRTSDIQKEKKSTMKSSQKKSALKELEDNWKGNSHIPIIKYTGPTVRRMTGRPKK